MEENNAVKIMEQYKDKYPDWFDEDENYIPGSKENRIERIKDELRDVNNKQVYGQGDETDVTALQTELAELSESPISYADQVNSMIRAKYSLSEELAILRQRDDKPEEYQSYFDYCEQCKQHIKNKMDL